MVREGLFRGVSLREFPGALVVRNLNVQCHGPGSFPGPGTKILHAAWHRKRERRL